MMRLKLGSVVIVLAVLLAGCSIFSIDSRTSSSEQGGTRILLEVAPGVQVSDDAIDLAAQILERRANSLGVSSVTVQRQGNSRIIIELPGVATVTESDLNLLTEVGLLEFVDFSTYGSALVEGSCILTDRQVELAQARLPAGETPLAPSEYTCPSVVAGAPPDPANLMPDGTPFHTVMTGAGLDDASAEVQSSGVAAWIVNFSLKPNGEGVQNFIDYVANNSGRQLAIVLDGRLLSAPTINAYLSQAAQVGDVDGGIISGRFTRDDARTLAAQLRYGALPVPLDVVIVDTVQ